MVQLNSINDAYEYFFEIGDRDHAHSLRELAKECSSVFELGVRGMNSCSFILKGLTENRSPSKFYTGIDFTPPSADILNAMKLWAENEGIGFQFMQANDLDIHSISTVDLLHIDCYHTYRHLTHELETFSKFTRKYILVHDTNQPYGFKDEDTIAEENPVIYKRNLPNNTRYASWIDREKQGLWAAIEDFLLRHNEWSLMKRIAEGTGLTVLKRIG